LYCSAGDLIVLRSERGEFEAVNDDRSKGCQSRVRDLSTERHDEEDVCFWILDRLDSLMAGEMVVLDALTIPRDAVHGDEPFARGEEFGGRGKIREDEQTDNTPSHADRAKDQEDILPLCQTRIDMPHRMPNQSPEHGCETVGAVVGFETEGLLCRGVPDGHHEDKSRVDGCFDRAEEEAVRSYSSEGGTCRCCEEDSTPGDGSI
jgi:hypothetical protein